MVAEVSAQLDQMNVEWLHIDEVIFKTHKDQLLDCYDLLYDQESKRIYKEVIARRMMGVYGDLEIYNGRQYFAIPPFMRNNPKEIFVDCGAFVGDSVERYIWERDGVFSKIIAFEPDPNNFSAMKRRISRLKKEWNLKEDSVSLYPYGIGEKSVVGKLERYIDNNGLGSKMMEQIETCSANADTGAECRVVALDDFINEPVTFIKADIESYEYKMLLGARETIVKNNPLIAVCIYHNGVDLYSIPLLLKSIVPEYNMAIRHHSLALDDTVLYAWID